MLALAFNDQEFYEGDLTPSTVDQDGKAFINPDGTPLDGSALTVSWSSSNPAVAAVEASGKHFKITSGDPGFSEITASIGPYPNGATKTFQINCAIANSAPGDPVVTGAVSPETPATP